MKETTQNLLKALCDVYLVGLLVLIMISWLTQDTFWPFAFMINILPFLFVPIPLIMGFVLTDRHFFRIALISTTTIAFLVMYGGLFVPRLSDQAQDGTPLRVVTYNTLGTSTPPEELVAFIHQSDADIISLQELHTSNASAIESQLSEEYPYMVLYPAQNSGIPGIGILSRYPIIEEKQFTTAGSGLPHIRTVIQIDDQSVCVYAVHIRPPNRTIGPIFQYSDLLRGEDINALIEYAAEDEWVLMAGDFNMAVHSDDWRRMRQAGYADAYATAGFGFGFTFPNGGVPALIRIDYVFTDDNFFVRNAWVGDGGYADHHPVYVDVLLRP